MNEELSNTLQKTFLELPQALRDLFVSSHFEGVLSRVAEGHPLQDHQRIAVENEIMLVLLGLENPNGLVTNIRHRAQISRDRTEKIVKVINENILIPNRELLEEAFLNRDKERESNKDVGSVIEDKKRPSHEYAVDPYREPI
ncbi:hypothetical protein IIB51_01030 [Patescibacteria group bacterium]|nr:hypothetical protein [Patescibacteria group bacterium]MCH8888964.1 hypothetical protein [Patescibacteria group bacterium]